MRVEDPELFDRAYLLEDTINQRRARSGKDPVYLTRFNTPLRTLVDPGTQFLPLIDDIDSGCDSGWRMT
ncbi:hypothetical protein ACFYXQ_15710 [Nocardia jiangxiensis]|uniref:Uncharacterized protein n=1 Tax=Nocardia jiangxiensis TaxID=282685 RepID=A0ABW6RYW0_9NOCA